VDNENAAEVIERMIKAIGGHTQADLSKILEVSAASISAARRKDKIPPEWIVKLAILKNVSPAWLKYGHGPQAMIFLSSQHDSTYDKMTYIIQTASRFSEIIEVRNDIRKTIDYLIAIPGFSLEYFELGLRYDKPSDAAKINLIETTCWDVGVSVKQIRVPDKKLIYFSEDPPMNFSEALNAANAFGEEVSAVVEEYVKAAGASIEEIKPWQTDAIGSAEEIGHSIYELLNMASKVLESETIYKNSLALNIRALHKATEAEERVRR